MGLAKGENSIEVGTVAELLPVLETVKKCVEAGELVHKLMLPVLPVLLCVSVLRNDLS